MLVFPAASVATASAILRSNFPTVLTNTDEFVAVNVYVAPEPESVVPRVHAVDEASFVTSPMRKPLTASEKVAVIV